MKKPRKRGGATFLCPECGAATRVLRTSRDSGGRVTRIRACNRRRSHERFSTVEKERDPR